MGRLCRKDGFYGKKYEKSLWTEKKEGHMPELHIAKNEYDEANFIIEATFNFAGLSGENSKKLKNSCFFSMGEEIFKIVSPKGFRNCRFFC